jgi:zinc transport system substrate-binding protein
MKKLCLCVACAALLGASCRSGKTSDDAGTPVVVATTGWTAAYAEMAGAENVVVLAPFAMEHPSEYELRPGDIPAIMEAEMIVYAGYEVMTERLKKGLDIPQDKLLSVNTDYSYVTIEQSVMAIAEKLGTETLARENLLDLKRAYDDGRDALRKHNMSGKPVMVHRFQASVARELGLVPTVLFGPASPEAPEIAAASREQVFMIIDNIHNPVGQPFQEVLPGSAYVQLLNFPGREGIRTLADVVRHNVSQITEGHK